MDAFGDDTNHNDKESDDLVLLGGGGHTGEREEEEEEDDEEGFIHDGTPQKEEEDELQRCEDSLGAEDLSVTLPTNEKEAKLFFVREHKKLAKSKNELLKVTKTIKKAEKQRVHHEKMLVAHEMRINMIRAMRANNKF